MRWIGVKKKKHIHIFIYIHTYLIRQLICEYVFYYSQQLFGKKHNNVVDSQYYNFGKRRIIKTKFLFKTYHFAVVQCFQ